MTNEELIEELEEVERNIQRINGEYKDTEKWYRVRKIQRELEYFDVTITKNNELNIYYDCSRLFGMHIITRVDEQLIVCPMMTLYTIVSYRIQKAKKYCRKEMYNKLQKERQQLGNIVREVCTQEFAQSDCIITRADLKKLKRFIQCAEPQLYHCVGEIGEVSTEVVPSDADKLQKIREIYQSFKIGTKYVCYYDEIMEEEVKISIDSTDNAYAIMAFLSAVYLETIAWLKEYEPSGQWCPIVPWKLLQELRMIIGEMFFSPKR